MSASPSDSAIVRVTVNLTNPPLNITFNSTTMAYAKNVLFNQSVADSSNNDALLRSDLDYDGVPDDPGENMPTPIRLIGWVTPLTINVIDFYADINNDSVNIHFKLENQNELSRINIQRSVDGYHFQTIRVLSEIQRKNDFLWSDRNPNKINYYRLELITTTGSSQKSSVVVVTLRDVKPFALTVIPNPFHEFINFSVTLSTKENITSHIIDFTGKVLYSEERKGTNGENKILISNISRLPHGIYLLQVKVGKNILTKTIMKN